MTQEAFTEPSLQHNSLNNTTHNAGAADLSSGPKQTSSTLIEFPGAARAVPEWRKQLSQRVREVQERKAREAAEELAAAQEAGLVSCALPSGQLELVPDLEQPVMNPIVTKALERIDRARRNDFSGSQFTAAATARAFDPDVEALIEPEIPAASPSESKPRLTVVARRPIARELPLGEPASEIEPDVVTADVPAAEAVLASETNTEILIETVAEVATQSEPDALPALERDRKPVRVISEDDVALSYLENCLSVPALPNDSRYNLPGLTRRTISGVFDLLLVALMVSPAVAAIEYSRANWAAPRTIGILAGITAATMFVYFTVTTALTGRTLAKRIFSLRTIDLRTGMIPTGGQSIKRAIGHVFSLAIAGLGLAYILIDPDQRTLHDRFSQTIVIKD
jgi:uncharacterized RDD family membrane protein YckC